MNFRVTCYKSRVTYAMIYSYQGDDVHLHASFYIHESEAIHMLVEYMGLPSRYLEDEYISSQIESIVYNYLVLHVDYSYADLSQADINISCTGTVIYDA